MAVSSRAVCEGESEGDGVGGEVEGGMGVEKGEGRGMGRLIAYTIRVAPTCAASLYATDAIMPRHATPHRATPCHALVLLRVWVELGLTLSESSWCRIMWAHACTC